MEIKADSFYKEMQALGMQASAGIEGIQPQQLNPTRANFSEMLGNAINGVNERQLASRQAQIDFELGNSSLSLAEVMVMKEKSSIAFEATMQTRNKVLEAYKQIMQMPV